jgi:hypothetical protein
MTSLADLFELHAKECRGAAERIDNPVHRVILLQMQRATGCGTRPRCAHRRNRHRRAQTLPRVLKTALPEFCPLDGQQPNCSRSCSKNKNVMAHDNPMTTLRHACPFGQCVVLGNLVRETKRYFVYAVRDNRHAFIPKRSSAVHLNPCPKCPDMKRPDALP